MGQDSIEPIMTFEAPAGGTSCIVWIDSVSGDFLHAQKKAGILRVYNASIPT